MSNTAMLLTRRGFMLASAGAPGFLTLPAAEGDLTSGPWAGPATVRKVYLAGAGPAGPVPTWI